MRVQKLNNDWIRTWAFPIRESDASEEGFDQIQLNGTFNETEDYPGCPYCEGKGFIVCGKCKKISCYHGEEISQCQWCGNSSRVTYSENLDVSGGGY